MRGAELGEREEGWVEMFRRGDLEPSQKEMPAASAGVGKAGRAGQDDTREVAGTRPDDAEPPGVMVGGWVYCKCGQQPSEGSNNLNYIPKPCFGFMRMSEAEEKSDHGPGPCLDTR